MDVRKQVRRIEKHPWNRLLSILEDAQWVSDFCDDKADNLPIIPNLRCGAWYVPPDRYQKGCYFKSTDGHTHEWDFSLKRYNLDLLHTIQRYGGCVIVDSTRRGKSMPDALSKTIPIWCAVLNQASFQKSGRPYPPQLRIPTHIVGESEAAQISAKIEQWAQALLASDLPVPDLSMPLCPLFVSRAHEDALLEDIQGSKELNFYPLILISASRAVPTPTSETEEVPPYKPFQAGLVETRPASLSYTHVQGSGDDEEMWSFGLSPDMFWDDSHLRQLLESGKDGIQSAIQRTVAASRQADSMNRSTQDTDLVGLSISFGTRTIDHTFTQEEKETYALILHADVVPDSEVANGDKVRCEVMRLGIPSGKRGLSAFRVAIPHAIAAARKHLPNRILICSQEKGIGNDLNSGLAVSILAACFDEDRGYDPHSHLLTKADIRKRLQWITSLVPHSTPPSRAHLLRINEVLLSGAYKDDAHGSGVKRGRERGMDCD